MKYLTFSRTLFRSGKYFADPGKKSPPFNSRVNPVWSFPGNRGGEDKDSRVPKGSLCLLRMVVLRLVTNVESVKLVEKKFKNDYLIFSADPSEPGLSFLSLRISRIISSISRWKSI